MADIKYNQFKVDLLKGVHNLETASGYKLALFTASHTPAATDTLYSGLTGEVANGNGYTTGGATVTGVAVTDNAGTAEVDATDVTWTSSTITARYAILYKVADSKLVCLWDFSTDQSSSNGDFTVQFNASGLLNLT